MTPDSTVNTPGPSSDQHRPGETGTNQSRHRAALGWPAITLLIILGVGLILWRTLASKAGANTTQTAAATLPTVAVAKATCEDLYNEVDFPAEFRPYLQVELHAKVSGYVDRINVDIGDRVKAGQLLATLEVPELQAELNGSIAAEKRAQADYKDAHLVYTRLLAVEKAHPNLVAQQELDAAEAKDSTTDAAIAAARADREKYRTLIDYTKITAPFDGVVTHRYADPGALIQAGTTSDTQSMPLVRLSDNYHLRLDFPVSIAYINDIHVGDKVDVRVESLGGKTFSGVISRSAQKIDEGTRTMITEVEVANPNLELVPGMYAEAVLQVQRRPKAVAVPIEAVSQQRPPTVYIVNQASEIEVRPVSLGVETPVKFEVLSGLQDGDLVMIGARSAVKPGQKVETKIVGPLAQE